MVGWWSGGMVGWWHGGMVGCWVDGVAPMQSHANGGLRAAVVRCEVCAMAVVWWWCHISMLLVVRMNFKSLTKRGQGTVEVAGRHEKEHGARDRGGAVRVVPGVAWRVGGEGRW